MAPGTEVSPHSTQVTRLDGEIDKGSTVSSNNRVVQDEIDDTLDKFGQLTTGKPPRNLSFMRHCSSTAWLAEPVSFFFWATN